jgi:pantothenate kinase
MEKTIKERMKDHRGEPGYDGHSEWHFGQLEITADDCKILCQIIDLASARGLFKADNLLKVGQIHAKMVRLIQDQEQEKADGK